MTIQDFVGTRIKVTIGSTTIGTCVDWTEDTLTEVISSALANALFDFDHYYNGIDCYKEKQEYWNQFHLIRLKQEMRDFSKHCTFDDNKLTFKSFQPQS